MSEQERKAFIASGDLISISDAARFTPYSAEYLSLRARTGHLKATKIARNWLTTRGAVLSYLRSQQRKHSRAGQINSSVSSNIDQSVNTNRTAVYNLKDQNESIANGSGDRKVVS